MFVNSITKRTRTLAIIALGLVSSAMTIPNSEVNAANLVADLMYSGGMPTPDGLQSSGTSLYEDGQVVYYKNYQDSRRNLAITLATLSISHVAKILKAGANLTEIPMVRDPDAPRCVDAPVQTVQLRNAMGQMVTISDRVNCVNGHRSDWAGGQEAFFMEGLDRVATYGAP